MPGKRVQFDEDTLEAIEAVARDSGKSFQELAAEAFADLLKKHKQPVGAEGGAQGKRRRRRKASGRQEELTPPLPISGFRYKSPEPEEQRDERPRTPCEWEQRAAILLAKSGQRRARHQSAS
jgi:hypothetical protein